jgi:hypothetical protein
MQNTAGIEDGIPGTWDAQWEHDANATAWKARGCAGKKGSGRA